MTSATRTLSGQPCSDIDPFSDEFLADPFPGLAELRDAGPVVYLERLDTLPVAAGPA
jgi:4-methoxybenzoate monooxygenase (O-demethylating)